jgi:protein tyrosine/serine phosphatase
LQPERTLIWDGCVNVRDLGGHPTEDGRTTRFGAVVRADSVRALSDAGWDALLAYGVSRIVDLRLRSELALDPPRELDVEVVHVPLLQIDDEEWAEIDAIFDAQPDAAGSTRAVYLEFLERRRPQFAQAFAAVADAPEGTVVVHCQGGKDRTGLVVALLLRVVGVDVEAIVADYALSGPNLSERTSAWVAETDDELERERRRRIGSAPAEAMVAVLEELERRYGSVREYLDAAGVDQATVDKVRTRLVE